ncbi:MAG: MFS transporter [Oscillospiraceae bacterium]|nr:MFS transporter [Oscillospiraceae bacterium]
MTVKKTFSRTTALIAGTAMLLINGVIYAWSIYSMPFGAGFGWSSAQLGACFTVMLASFCLGGVFGGAVANRRGVRVSIPIGGILGCIGFVLCMFLQAHLIWLLFVSFAISGIGVGFVYNGVISAVVPRFPDKKGLASGVLLMGFGASSLVLGGLASRLIASPGFGWHLTYILTGALLLAAAFIGLPFVLPPRVDRDTHAAAPARGLTPRQMLRTKRFWLLFGSAVIGTGFGSGLIAHASYIFVEGGASESVAALAVGLVSVMNGLGRIVFGMLNDRCGFRISLLADAVLYIAAGLIAALVLGSSAVVLVVVMMLIGACYGAVPTISASLAEEFFGPAHYGRNLGIVNLSILVGSFASTAAGAIQTSTGSYAQAFYLFVGLEAVALVLILLLGRTKSIEY